MKRLFLRCLLLLLILPSAALGLSLDEALSLAREGLPFYQAAKLKASASETLATAALGPYYPRLDFTASADRHNSLDTDFSITSYQLSASYTLYDGGRRYANRGIALLNSSSAGEELRKALIDLEYTVKVAFYSALARRDSLELKKVQLSDAQKDYEVAGGRHKYGIAKLSDTLQASVRLEQAKYNVITAEGDLRKAVADLNSLIGLPLDRASVLEGSLELPPLLPSIAGLQEAALQRPEIREAENAVRIARLTRSLELSAFWPTLSASASYTRTRGAVPGTVEIPEDRTAGLSVRWNIFELGKIYRQKSAAISADAEEANLRETKRTLLLEVRKTYEDLVTAGGRLTVAREQLALSERNYSQAFGEYKLGKADILSLVQAESLLADAQDQTIRSRLNLLITKSQLERMSGVAALESLPSAPSVPEREKGPEAPPSVPSEPSSGG